MKRYIALVSCVLALAALLGCGRGMPDLPEGFAVDNGSLRLIADVAEAASCVYSDGTYDYYTEPGQTDAYMIKASDKLRARIEKHFSPEKTLAQAEADALVMTYVAKLLPQFNMSATTVSCVIPGSPVGYYRYTLAEYAGDKAIHTASMSLAYDGTLTSIALDIIV